MDRNDFNASAASCKRLECLIVTRTSKGTITLFIAVPLSARKRSDYYTDE